MEKTPLWSTCPIRKCALGNNIKNCGYCLDYPCPRVNWLIHATNLIAERTRKEGTQEEYERFALPYLNKARLDEIHERVGRTTTGMEFKPVNNSTLSYPSRLNPKALSGTKLKPHELQETMQKLHSKLESMMTLHCRTLGGQEQEMKRRKEGLKFLWVIARYGRLIVDDSPLIEVAEEQMKKQLKYGKHRINQKLQELADYGIEGNYIENKIEIKFTEESKVAVAIQHYIQLLLKNHSERTAFSKFWKADMGVFT